MTVQINTNTTRRPGIYSDELHVFEMPKARAERIIRAAAAIATESSLPLSAEMFDLTNPDETLEYAQYVRQRELELAEATSGIILTIFGEEVPAVNVKEVSKISSRVYDQNADAGKFGVVIKSGQQRALNLLWQKVDGSDNYKKH